MLLFAALAAALLGALAIQTSRLRFVQRSLANSQRRLAAEKANIDAIGRQAAKLSDQIQHVERQNAEIRKAIGIQS